MKIFKENRYLAVWFMTILMVIGLLCGCGAQNSVNPPTSTVQQTTSFQQQTEPETTEETSIDKDGTYTSKDEVALYIHTYNKLPSNYITKKEAEKLGWESKKGNMEEAAPGKSIGGSRFGNYDGNLPEEKGRRYYECDIDFDGGYRGAKRIIYSNDGLVFYTEDHYKTFEQLY